MRANYFVSVVKTDPILVFRRSVWRIKFIFQWKIIIRVDSIASRSKSSRTHRNSNRRRVGHVEWMEMHHIKDNHVNMKMAMDKWKRQSTLLIQLIRCIRVGCASVPLNRAHPRLTSLHAVCCRKCSEKRSFMDQLNCAQFVNWAQTINY